MILGLCIHYLHRHPSEVDLPLDALVDLAAIWLTEKEASRGH